MQPSICTLHIPERADIYKPAALQAHELSYLHWGMKGEAVLCVHGLTRNGRDFDDLATALAEKYQVICPDMPGRGLSEWLKNPLDYNVSTYIADILHLLDSLGIKTVHWVGTSMGGIIALTMAAMRPGLIKSVVLNDIGCQIPAAGLKRILSYAGVQTSFPTLADAQANLRMICEPFGIPDEAHWQHLFKYSLVQRSSWQMHYDPAIVTPMKGAEPVDVVMWPLWEAVKSIPVLLIRGESSDILTKETALAMQTTHPNLQLLEIKNAGHAPALMTETEINSIKNWLTKVC